MSAWRKALKCEAHGVFDEDALRRRHVKALEDQRIYLPLRLLHYPFAGGPAHHLLIKTPLGKVTLLLIPGKQVGARALTSARGPEAAVVPASAGSFAVVGDSPRTVRRVEGAPQIGLTERFARPPIQRRRVNRGAAS